MTTPTQSWPKCTPATALWCPKCEKPRYHTKAEEDGKIECIVCHDVHYQTAPPIAKDYKSVAAGDDN